MPDSDAEWMVGEVPSVIMNMEANTKMNTQDELCSRVFSLFNKRPG